MSPRTWEEAQVEAERNEVDLATWRRIGPALDLVVGAALAGQGDAADPDLIALQHTLAGLLRSPANTQLSV